MYFLNSDWPLQHPNSPLNQEYHFFLRFFFSAWVATSSVLSRGPNILSTAATGPSGLRGPSSRGQMLWSSSLSSLSSTEVRKEVLSVESSSLGVVTHLKVPPGGKRWRRDLLMVTTASATLLVMEARRAGSFRASSSFTQERKTTLF